MDPLLTPSTVFASILFGMVSSYIAYSRKKNPFLWFFIGLVFGIFGFFALFLASPKKNLKKTLPPPRPILQGPKDKFWFYLDTTHQKVGPISYNAIGKALEQGQISKTTYVWHEDLTDWKQLEELYKI
jgi:vacuolar-type H+-ATPase subunit I/STV1